METFRMMMLDMAARRAWRVADASGPPFGEGKHGAAIRRAAGLTTAFMRRSRVANRWPVETRSEDDDLQFDRHAADVAHARNHMGPY